MNIFIIGSIAFDELNRFDGHFKDIIKPDMLDDLSVCFIVNEFVQARGGTCGNICYALGLMKTEAYPCSPVGNDGESYIQLMQDWGMDTSYADVLPGFTPKAVITTDLDDNQIATYSPGVTTEAVDFVLPENARKGDIFWISPENKSRMLLAIKLASEAGLIVYFDPGQMTHVFSKEDYAYIFKYADALFVNQYEWELIQTIYGKIPAIDTIIVTKSADGVDLYQNGKKSSYSAQKISAVSNPTGAGDAFRGAFIAGIKQDFTQDICVQMGTILAAACVEVKQTQNYILSEDRLHALEMLGFAS